MASFNRADYEEVYSFARKMFYLTNDEELEKTSALIMLRCEDVLGQMSSSAEEAAQVRKAARRRT